MKWDKIVSLSVGGVGVFINRMWGGVDAMFTALLSLMALDFIAGVVCGFKHCELSSNKAYIGITQKKMMILIMVAVAVVVDSVLNSEGATRSLAIFYYIGMEGLSLLETAGRLDFPIPDELKERFSQLNGDNK